jgi:uncharacterized membrane protein
LAGLGFVEDVLEQVGGSPVGASRVWRVLREKKSATERNVRVRALCASFMLRATMGVAARIQSLIRAGWCSSSLVTAGRSKMSLSAASMRVPESYSAWTVD